MTEPVGNVTESSPIQTKQCMRIHLVGGEVVDGYSGDAMDAVVEAKDQLNVFKDVLKEMFKSPRGDGWQLSMNMPGGGWAIFPRSSVSYLEFVGFGADDD